MKRHGGCLINFIGVLIIIALTIMGVREYDRYQKKINWIPTEIYEFTNKYIDWD